MFSCLSSDKIQKNSIFYGYSLDLCYQCVEVYVTKVSRDFNGF